MTELYYSQYLHLNSILDSQQPISAQNGILAHDEMLFIITHQAYELWFKQIIYELDSIILLFGKEKVDDNSADMSWIVRRLRRITEIWHLLVKQIEVLETMTSLDFLEFRNLLIPASGFQSLQFKMIEAKLGMKFERRHGAGYYRRVGFGGLSEQDFESLVEVEAETDIKQLLIRWLDRTPFLIGDFWNEPNALNRFWDSYRQKYLESLNTFEDEAARKEEFQRIFVHEGQGDFSPIAMRAALFIMAYRDYPIFHLPYELLNGLFSVDQQMSTWRHRHLMMVNRMIGLRVGTGGINREGKNQEGYLEGSIKRHRVFWELSDVSTYLVERRNLPSIPSTLSAELGFHHQ